MPSVATEGTSSAASRGVRSSTRLSWPGPGPARRHGSQRFGTLGEAPRRGAWGGEWALQCFRAVWVVLIVNGIRVYTL